MRVVVVSTMVTVFLKQDARVESINVEEQLNLMYLYKVIR